MKPYLGIDNGGEQMVGLRKKVVLELTGKLDVDRTVVNDNSFTSLDLLRQLRKRDLGLIGIVRKNRRELPQAFTSKKCVAESVKFGFNTSSKLVSYSPWETNVLSFFPASTLDPILMP